MLWDVDLADVFSKWIVNMYHLDPHLLYFTKILTKTPHVKKNLTLKKTHKKYLPLKILASGTHLPTAPWRNHGNLRVPEYHHPKTFLRDYIIWTTMIRYWGTLIKIPMTKAPRSADAFSFTFAFMAFAFSIAIALDSFTTLSTWTAIHRPGAQGDHWWRTGERDLFLP